MNHNNDIVKRKTIRELISSGKEYRIPLYQRNFSWGKPEVKQMIRDIADFAIKDTNKKYYLGILVVYKTRINGQYQFEVVDGQQRLTVLLLLMHYLNKEIDEFSNSALRKDDITMELNFAHRPKAKFTLKAILENNLDSLDNRKTHYEIANIYDEIEAILHQVMDETGCTLNKFYKYINSNVVLYRSSLPDDTELNHYFEVMNNRGEQLEKHEILKAKMMSTVNESALDHEQQSKLRNSINLIWEACSDMNRYVQYGFSKDLRTPLFGKEWNSKEEWFRNESYSQLSKIMGRNKMQSSNKVNIESILANGPSLNSQGIKTVKDDQTPDRIQSVINFQNFLLQVLRIYQHKNNKEITATLDDKVLLDEFEKHINEIDFVKNYILLLLKARFLFDQYVVKRMYKDDNDDWRLMKLKYYPKEEGRKQESESYVNAFEEDHLNQDALMLLSMFHVSTPTQNYKHWLTAVLNYLVEQKEIIAQDYISYMKDLSRKLFYDRFMVNEPGLEGSYDHIVFINPERLKYLENKRVRRDLLSYKQIKNNLVFNYLDYLIWKEQYENNDTIRKFEFKFRSSVEHFNPRNPIEHRRLQEEDLNRFGNLCLIAHGMNSSFSNNNPLSKAYSNTSKSSLDSLKLHLMMKKVKDENREDSDYGGWGPEQIEEHEYEMIEKLESVLSN